MPLSKIPRITIPHMGIFTELYETVNFDHKPCFHDFDIFTMEETYPGVKSQFPIHTRDFYMIYFLEDLQEGEVVINDSSHRDLKNALLFLGPEHLFGGLRGRAMKGFSIAFDLSLISHLKKNPSLEYSFFDAVHNNLFKLSDKDQEELHSLISCLHQQRGHRETAAYLLMGLLERCRVLGEKYSRLNLSHSTEYELIRDFKSLIRVHMAEQHSVEFYAARLNMSSNYLNERVKTLTGKTAKALIAERLLLEAKSLLLHSGMNASSIAYALGFTDSSYFGRFFKKNTGTSPGRFKADFALSS